MFCKIKAIFDFLHRIIFLKHLRLLAVDRLMNAFSKKKVNNGQTRGQSLKKMRSRLQKEFCNHILDFVGQFVAIFGNI